MYGCVAGTNNTLPLKLWPLSFKAFEDKIWNSNSKVYFCILTSLTINASNPTHWSRLELIRLLFRLNLEIQNHFTFTNHQPLQVKTKSYFGFLNTTVGYWTLKIKYALKWIRTIFVLRLILLQILWKNYVGNCRF